MKRTQRLLAHLSPNVQHETFDDASKTSKSNLLTGNKLSSQIANPSPFLHGGFEPVRKEYENAQCSVTFGKVPLDLDGMYCKNGPNSYFDPPADAPYHWFDGDGMLHGVDIRNGKAIYTNRYVMSKRLQQDKARGNSVYNMGALNSGDLSATLDERVMDSNGRLYGRMNTNVVFHGHRLLALEETDLPYHISTVGLETVGRYNFIGKLDHPMTAHPKICPVTGEMFISGHEVSPDPAKAFCSLTVAGKDGQIKSSIQIPLRGSRFMHDMGLTQKYVIIIDLPAAFDFQTEGSPWTFDRTMPLRFGVIPRYATDPNQVVWFEAKSGMIFHTINAFDSGPNQVTMQCCRAEAYTMGFNRSTDPDNWLFPYEWVLDVNSGKVLQERKLCDIRCDFPTVSPKMVSQRQQFSYYSTYRARSGDNVPLYDGLVKLDHNSLQAVHIQLQPHLSCAEFSFVSRKEAKSEDDGYLLTFVYNDKTRTSELVIYDAKHLVSGDGEKCCICRISLPQRVPYGFHGNWISRRNIETAINC